MKKKLSPSKFSIYTSLILIVLLLFFSGCARNVNFAAVSGISADNLWGINETSGFIEPIPDQFNRTVRVEDLVIANESSLKIGEGIIQSKISSNTLLDGSFNRTILVTDRDTLTESNFDGTLYSAVFNLNDSVNSAASLSAFNNNEDALHLMKLGTNMGGDAFIINENGNLNIITINGTFIELGVYKNLSERVSSSPLKTIETINDDTVELSIENNLIILNAITNVEENLYFNHRFTNTNPRTSPPEISEYIALFARDDDNLYIKRSNGDIKRVSVVGSGSSVFSEVTKFNNHSYFYGNVYLNNSVYNGASVGFACIDEIGRLFKSDNPCDTTSTIFTRGNITDPTMGDE